MIKNIIKLMRPYQYYKNLVIFLPLIFGRQLFNYHGIISTILGFVSLSLISSFNYIINDIKDLRQDKAHPEKKHRPLASGKLKIGTALLVGGLLAFISMVIAILLSVEFLYFILALLVLSTLYTFFLKNEAFIDVIIIAINFVIRAISGAFVITINRNPYVSVSQWLIFCPFFLSLFLSIGKREADLKLLGKHSTKHKKVLKYYTQNITKSLLLISTTLLIMVYSLYIFFSDYKNLIITLPISLYVIFRYLYLIETGSPITRHPHKMIKDRKIMIGSFVWVLLVMVVIYL